jgi:hypothetical protein
MLSLNCKNVYHVDIYIPCNFEVNMITHLGVFALFLIKLKKKNKVSVLKCGTQFWKRTTQELFQQSLVEIGSIVSEEKIFFLISSPLFSNLHNRSICSKKTKFLWNSHWMVLFQKCVWQFGPLIFFFFFFFNTFRVIFQKL